MRLHPLLSGEMHAPRGLLEAPSGPLRLVRGLEIGRSREDWLWLPIPAFLVEHPGAGPFLVDTGLHPSVALDPHQSFGSIAGRLNDFRFEPGQAVAAQLRDRGVNPADVGLVVMTHLHTDHASGVSEFPDATFLVDRREWASATAARGLPRGYRTQQFDYGFDWREVDFETGDIDSFGSFGASIDLFGDGSVRLVSTPGHSAGHMSLVLRLRGREALLTADAAYTLRAIREDVVPLVFHDLHRWRRSLHEVRRFVDSTPGLVVVPGHDGEAWAQLDDVYE
ncbi:MAG: N-acyl homoserine lactone hydrolase [Solirubrobacteraceae bacterium]|nr:N-acyl homoserine lactone hydrolase [Solirubrobacteraceae bacterium]